MPVAAGLSPVLLRWPRVWRQSFLPRLRALEQFHLSSASSPDGYVCKPATAHPPGRSPFFAWLAESSCLGPCCSSVWVCLVCVCLAVGERGRDLQSCHSAFISGYYDATYVDMTTYVCWLGNRKYQFQRNYFPLRLLLFFHAVQALLFFLWLDFYYKIYIFFLL